MLIASPVAFGANDNQDQKRKRVQDFISQAKKNKFSEWRKQKQ
jgi:hypothetical protein